MPDMNDMIAAQQHTLSTGMIAPATPAHFYDFNDQLVATPLISLTTLVVALKAKVRLGFEAVAPGSEESARKLLSAPDEYPLNGIVHHLELARLSTNVFYGRELTLEDETFLIVAEEDGYEVPPREQWKVGGA